MIAGEKLKWLVANDDKKPLCNNYDSQVRSLKILGLVAMLTATKNTCTDSRNVNTMWLL